MDLNLLIFYVVKAIETKDIVVKKMVYLYLCNYAHKQPDMAIMCINTLRRDWYGHNLLSLTNYIILFLLLTSDNEDPMVRGFALRSLCSLRLESMIEYIDQPVRKALSDISPYVRKTGVMGILKVTALIF